MAFIGECTIARKNVPLHCVYERRIIIYAHFVLPDYLMYNSIWCFHQSSINFVFSKIKSHHQSFGVCRMERSTHLLVDQFWCVCEAASASVCHRFCINDSNKTNAVKRKHGEKRSNTVCSKIGDKKKKKKNYTKVQHPTDRHSRETTTLLLFSHWNILCRQFDDHLLNEYSW